MPTYVIEHLEPKLFPWCIIEYKHISKIVGKNNLWFTNIKNKDKTKLNKYGRVFSQSIKDIKLENACILDPEAKKLLTPKDKFSFYIFGGILGDYPPKKRTKTELTKFIRAESRNIGKKQFSTDNAVYVVKKIQEGKKFQNLKFQNTAEIKINNIESIELPYLYNLVNNKPLISPELISYLKKKKSF